MTEPQSPAEPVQVACAVSDPFVAWMSQMGGSLVISTYQAGKVAMVGWDGRQVSLLMRDFDKPMGMAVDANVIIYERIREYLREGYTARAAIEAGYERAFATILDSQLTTAIAGLVLWQYGSGPIRGFAITLLIGIIASMITAVFVTRTFFMIWLQRRPAMTTLSV